MTVPPFLGADDEVGRWVFDLRAKIKTTAVADLNQDISASYVEAEVQAISDKVDAILAALRAAGLTTT
jgi:acetolactate synthase small subunit